jgi:hypothetical protein
MVHTNDCGHAGGLFLIVNRLEAGLMGLFLPRARLGPGRLFPANSLPIPCHLQQPVTVAGC